jgi:hypothetical protein
MSNGWKKGSAQWTNAANSSKVAPKKARGVNSHNKLRGFHKSTPASICLVFRPAKEVL